MAVPSGGMAAGGGRRSELLAVLKILLLFFKIFKDRCEIFVFRRLYNCSDCKIIYMMKILNT